MRFSLRSALAALFLAGLLWHLSGKAYAQAKGVQQAQKWNKSAALSLASRILVAAPKLAKIWPGYWPVEQPFIIYMPGTGALLVSAGEKPASFQPVGSSTFSNRLAGKAFWHSGALPHVQRPFIIGYPIGPSDTAILVDADGTSQESTLTLLMHEQFHGYQKGGFKRAAVAQFVNPLAIRDRGTFAASAELERRVLIKALGVKGHKERQRLLQRYFSLRREREAMMPPEVVKVEHGLERLEGTAKYVDQAAQATIADAPSRLPFLLQTELRKPLASKTGAFATHWFRTRSYSTGAALTYFISLLGTADWRTKLEQGATPAELLESLLTKPPAAEAQRLANDTRALFGYQLLRKELRPIVRAGEKAEIKSAQEFLAPGPYRLVFEGKAAGKGSVGFDAVNMAQLGPATMALPEAAMFNFSAPLVSVSGANLPALHVPGAGVAKSDRPSEPKTG